LNVLQISELDAIIARELGATIRDEQLFVVKLEIRDIDGKFQLGGAARKNARIDGSTGRGAFRVPLHTIFFVFVFPSMRAIH